MKGRQMSQIGRYNGVDYRRMRHCDVFPGMERPMRAYQWFPIGEDGKPTGDHFRTKREMCAAIDD